MLLIFSSSASPFLFSPDDLIVAEREQLGALLKEEQGQETKTETEKRQ